MQRPEQGGSEQRAREGLPGREDTGDYNLTATFADVSTARRAVGALRRRGFTGEAIALDDAADVPAVDEARMRDELEGSAGVATKSMLSGAASGGLIGVVVGAVVGFIIGAAVFGGGVGTVITVVVVAVALGVAGGVVGGFAKPRVDPAAIDVPPTAGGATAERAATGVAAPDAVRSPAPQGVVLQVHVTTPDQFAEAEDVLVHAGPLRVDRFTEGGQVIGTEELGLDAPPVQPGSGRVVRERPQDQE